MFEEVAMRVRSRVGVVLGAAAVLFGLVLASSVIATPPDNHKVTICHATNSNTNPYLVIDVDIASSGYLKAGHNGHEGPIWYDGAKDAKVKWGDIIPSYDYAQTSFHFDGLNWTEEGEAIWDNGCVIGTETAQPTPEQSVAGETDVPTVAPTPFQTQLGETDAPSLPATSTSVGQASGPGADATALFAMLAGLLAALVMLTPGATRAHGSP